MGISTASPCHATAILKHRYRTRAVLKRAVLASFAALSLAIAAQATANDTSPKQRAYILSTATTGGTFYPVGVAIATLTKVKLGPETGISLSAISSAGSAENIKLLRTGEAKFAILQGLYTAWSWTGTGRLSADGPQTHLRTITKLWDNVEHFAVNTDIATTGTMDDLKTLNGRPLSIGKRNSGAEGSTSHILNALGIDIGKDVKPIYQGYGPSADAMQDGRIAGMSTPAGPPVSAVTRAMAARSQSIRLLNFSDNHLKAVNAKYALWHLYVIAPDTYPGQTEAVTTIAHPNILVVHADVPDQVVYEITKAIYQNLDFLSSIHPAVRQMSLATAMDGLSAPLHPGALKFYTEAGQTIPQDLHPPL